MNVQEIFQAVPWVIIAPILLIESILLIVALVDLARNDSPNGPKWLWVLIILLMNIIGPILYFIIGRRQN
ncbi:PLD nuclease N-terminal domain-containing protein [Pontibacillus sp. HMF3514]|uniref:PLD nuclease N-terminal domain-containing protein n=1 Tax=Pontibacillus sp. HMF3514 TaxID=2692425 RepID=UPI00131F8C3A|nr:PLD nuclease N-terminal domain-containing protein [Pontibacillus sp. HMF3514]QHE51106.1 transcriptional regulator [Pontibacillus sp. HMF3514]